jgi:hypothetical protein
LLVVSCIREKEQKVTQFYFSTFGKGGAKRLALKLSKQVIWQYSNKINILIRVEERKLSQSLRFQSLRFWLHLSQRWKNKIEILFSLLSTIPQQNKKDVIHNQHYSFNTGERSQIFGT